MLRFLLWGEIEVRECAMRWREWVGKSCRFVFSEKLRKLREEANLSRSSETRSLPPSDPTSNALKPRSRTSGGHYGTGEAISWCTIPHFPGSHSWQVFLIDHRHPDTFFRIWKRPCHSNTQLTIHCLSAINLSKQASQVWRKIPNWLTASIHCTLDRVLPYAGAIQN